MSYATLIIQIPTISVIGCEVSSSIIQSRSFTISKKDSRFLSAPVLNLDYGKCFIRLQRDPAPGKFRHRRRHSVENESDLLQDEFNDKIAIAVKGEHSASDAGASPSSSLQMINASQFEQDMREQWAATCIQTAFRGVLVPNLLHLLTVKILQFWTKCLFPFVLNFLKATSISYTMCWITFLIYFVYCQPYLNYEETYLFKCSHSENFFYLLVIRWILCSIFLSRKIWKRKLIMCSVAESNYDSIGNRENNKVN